MRHDKRLVYGLMTVAVLALLNFAIAAAAQRPSDQRLQIYVVDVEGGNAILFVAPAGESVLIDTGNAGPGAVRDAERIAAAARDAGVTRIDHLITTHWHGDHFGAMEEVSKRLPIREFIDHGPSVQVAPGSEAQDFSRTTYPTLYSAAARREVKAGDRIVVAGLDWRIVTSNGAAISQPLPGQGAPNPACGGVEPQNPDPGENARSVGSAVRFGRFRVVHLGDLTWNKELELMCPANRLGTADLFVMSHHGLPVSNSPALVHALAPRVIVMNNGVRKGGQPAAMRTVFSSPGLEDLWQLHFSELAGQEYSAPGLFIANGIDEQPAAVPIEPAAPPAGGRGVIQPGAPVHNGPAYWIKVDARADGSFTVTNARNAFTKAYSARSSGR